jgi:hypothetical protein
MEAERTLYARTATMGQKGHIIEGPEQQVEKEKFEFGVPADALSRVILGGYFSNWNGDALQRELGKEGTCSRFYYDTKVCVDIGDPESELARKKRKILFKSGLGYLCIPPNFPQKEDAIRKIYEASLRDYEAYELRHPRPAVLQETLMMDEKGNMRRAIVTAIDIKPGGKIVGSREQQQKELKHGVKLTEREIKFEKLRAKLNRRIVRAIQNKTPFRNPFIAKNQRQFPVVYEAH